MKKGQRVKFSKRWLDENSHINIRIPYRDRRGTFVRHTVSGMAIVKWDCRRSLDTLSQSFIEEADEVPAEVVD